MHNLFEMYILCKSIVIFNRLLQPDNFCPLFSVFGVLALHLLFFLARFSLPKLAAPSSCRRWKPFLLCLLSFMCSPRRLQGPRWQCCPSPPRTPPSSSCSSSDWSGTASAWEGWPTGKQFCSSWFWLLLASCLLYCQRATDGVRGDLVRLCRVQCCSDKSHPRYTINTSSPPLSAPSPPPIHPGSPSLC